MGKSVKKFAVLLLALAMCFAVAGCKKETGEKTPTGNVYVPAFSEVKSDFDWIRSVLSNGSSVMLIGDKYDYETYESSTVIMMVDVATGETTTKELTLGENESFDSIIAAGDGYAAVSNSYIQPTDEEIESGIYEGENHYSIVWYDGDFNEISRLSLDDLADKVKEESGWFYVNYFAVDKEDNIYLSYDTTLYVLNKEGNEVCSISFENWINGLTAADDGQVYVHYYDWSSEGEGGLKIAPVDLQAKAVGNALENIKGSDYGTLYPAGEGKFYTTTNTKLYLYDVASQTSEEILDWIDCDINSSNLRGFAALNDGSFVAVSTTYDYSGDKTEVTVELANIKEVPASSVAQKKEITFAMLYLDYDMQESVIKFNRSSQEYKISIKTYVDDDYSNYEDALTLFNSDLATGSIADMFILPSGGGVSMANLAAKGVLTDLTELIENDPDISMDDFIPNIIEALSINGKLYGISDSFNIQTLVGKTKNVGSGTSWTFKEVLEMAQKHPDAMLFQYATKSSSLSTLLQNTMDSFYDPATGECHFDEEDFVSLLELCNTFPAEYNSDQEYVSFPKLLREDTVLLEAVWLSDFDQVQLYLELFGEPVNFIGYPTSSGSGAIANFNEMMCISSKSKNKEGAFAFIKQFLTYEHQSSLEWSLPINQAAFEDKITKAMETNEDGTNTWIYDDVEVEIGALTEEEAQLIRDIIYSADHTSAYDEQLFNIISEEAAAYFEGQKSAKEVAGLIQSRAQIYMDESR